MPDASAQELFAKTRKLIGMQIGVGCIVAAGFYMAQGLWEALSAGYGAAISLLMALLLSWGVGMAARYSGVQSQIILYTGAGLRFFMVLVLLAIGLAFLELAPFATVVGFIAAQLVFVVAARTP